MTDGTSHRSAADAGEALVQRVVSAWRLVAGVSQAFTVPGVVVEVRRASPLCPVGWVGAVRLRSSALVVVPDAARQVRVSGALTGADAGAVVDPVWWRDKLAVADAMGPATLGYADAATATLVLSAGVSQSTLDDPEVERLLGRVPADDLLECGIAYTTSPMFVLREGHQAVAVAAYRVWAGRFAHLSLLTDPLRRGEGLGRTAASAAAAHALGEGLVLQWRARPADSRAVGRALGFTELGSQLSVRVAAD